MKILLTYISLLLLTAVAAQATTHTVSLDGSADHTSIDAAMQAAVEGDTVLIMPGYYEEMIEFTGANIRVCSLNPRDWRVVTQTIITPSPIQVYPVLFYGTETSSTLLEGFTITQGKNGIIGQGRSAKHTQATIQYNIIFRNGGGTSSGGGIWGCNGIIRNNYILHNKAIYFAAPFDHPFGNGGGISECHGEIYNNVIAFNEANAGGGGIFQEGSFDASIHHNTIYGNRALYGGGGSIASPVSDCIIWGNHAQQTAGEQHNLQIGYINPPKNCIIQDWDSGGTNSGEDPKLADPSNYNFLLSEGSSAIDAGSTLTMQLDLLGLPRSIQIKDDTLHSWNDIGAFEYRPGFSQLRERLLATSNREFRAIDFNFDSQVDIADFQQYLILIQQQVKALEALHELDS